MKKNRLSKLGVKNNYISHLTKILNAGGCIWTAILMIIIMIDVSGRYFFNRPLIGTPEIIQISIVGITFLQIPYVQLIDEHLSVTVLYDKLGKKLKKIIDLTSSLLGIFVFGIIIYSGWKLLLLAIKINECDGSMASVMVPTWPVRFLIFFCSIIMVLIQIRQLSKLFQRKK